MSLHSHRDPEIAAILAQGPPPVDFGQFNVADIPALRVQINAMFTAMSAVPADDRFTTEERLVPGPDGAPDVKLKIYRPVGLAASAPVMY